MSIAKNKYNIVKRLLLIIFTDNIVYNILKYYWEILDNKELQLLDWIDINNLDWYYLSSNPNAIDLLKKNKKKINKLSILRNPNGIKLINNFEIVYGVLCENPNAIHLLNNNINWFSLSRNPNAIHILECNQDKIEWEYLSLNKNAIHLLKNNKDKIDWEMLSLNENAIELLEEKIYYEQYIIRSNYSSEYLVNWRYLSSNPNAIHLLLDNKDKIDWCWLSKNPNAIDLLKENQDKINWKYFSKNPAIFKAV
jgi:hypothetical protein